VFLFPVTERIFRVRNVFSQDQIQKTLDLLDDYRENPYKPGWKYTTISFPGSSNIFWNLKLNQDTFFTEELFTTVKETVETKFNELVELYDVYANGHTAGAQGDMHRDGPDNFRTFLVYCNREWAVEHCGGTVFFDDYKNEYITHQFIPFDCIYFHANIEHFSQTVSHSFRGLRTSVAFKLKLVA
jgi:hypothetical protein